VRGAGCVPANGCCEVQAEVPRPGRFIPETCSRLQVAEIGVQQIIAVRRQMCRVVEIKGSAMQGDMASGGPESSPVRLEQGRRLPLPIPRWLRWR
jgi:hypothetical protein